MRVKPRLGSPAGAEQEAQEAQQWPGRWAVMWLGLEKSRKRGAGEKRTSVFVLARLLASWQLDIHGYGLASCWDTLRQVCNGEADLNCQHENSSGICLGSRRGTQHRSVHSYRKKSDELIHPVIK